MSLIDRPSSNLWSLLLPVLAILALTTAAVAPALARGQLTVIGGSGARTLVLHPCHPARAKVSTGAIHDWEWGVCKRRLKVAGEVLVGTLTVALSNAMHCSARIQVLYARRDGVTARLPGASPFVYLSGLRSSRSPRRSIVVPARAIRMLRLRFSLGSGEPLSALDGTLGIRVLEPSTQVIGIPVTSSVPDPADLRLEPSELTLPTELGKDKAHAKLTVVGPDARLLLTAVNAQHTLSLHSGNGHEVAIEVSQFVPDEGKPGRVSATISVAGYAAPGAYRGDVTLFSLSPHAPRLTLTVNSHRAWWCAVLWVLVGVLVSAFLLRLLALNQRRNVLLAALSEALERLVAVRPKRRRGGQLTRREAREVRVAMWSMDDLASYPADAEGLPGVSLLSPAGDLSDVEALRRRIKSARNDRDLDDDADTVLEVIARIQRWLRLAPTAWLLCRVDENSSGRYMPQLELWQRTSTVHNTRLLQERLHYEPRTPAEADDLVEQVLWQAWWHHAMALLFRMTEKDAGGRRQVTALDRMMAARKSILKRSPMEREGLAVALRELYRRFDSMERKDLPNLLADQLKVNWQVTPGLFKGWATVDGTGWQDIQLSALERGRTRMRRLAPRLRPGMPLGRRLGRAKRRIAMFAGDTRRVAVALADLIRRRKPWAECLEVIRRTGSVRAIAEAGPSLASNVVSFVLLTLPILVVSSIVYMLTIYNETWGSTTDILTAVTAGFAGKAVIDWGSLPIFQSRRLRASAKAVADAAPALDSGARASG